MSHAARRVPAEVNYTKTSPLIQFAILCGGLLGVVVGLYVLLGIGVNWVAPHVPVAVEELLAKTVSQSIHANHIPAESEKVQALLDELLPYLSREDLRLHYRAYVIDHPMVNALALPGGAIVVFSGLLDELQSSDELTFVLGHELGHFHNRDHLRAMGRGLIALVFTAALTGADSFGSQFIAHRLQNVEMRFSQSQEKAADLFGLDLLLRAGKNPKSALSFFQSIHKQAETGVFAYYFASHPHPETRVAYLKQAIEMTDKAQSTILE